MQINGERLISSFSSGSLVREYKARNPLVIDVKPEFDSLQKTPQVSTATIVNPVVDSQAQQQSRFVRTFASRVGTSNLEVNQRNLPKGVQQYTQVSQLLSQSNQRLLDELV